MTSTSILGLDPSPAYPCTDRLVEHLPSGVLLYDAQGEVRSANAAARRILGGALDQIAGGAGADSRPPPLREDGSSFPLEDLPVVRALRAGETVRHEVMGVSSPAREGLTWIAVSAFPVQDDAADALQGVYAVFEDISAHKQAQAQEAVSLARLHAVFDAMSEGVAMHRLVRDAAGRPADYLILDVNSAFSTQTGLAREAMVGRLATVAYGSGSAPFLECYAEVVQTGRPQRFEAPFAPLGRRFRISVFSSEPDHFVTVFEDLTESKRAEEALGEREAQLRSIGDNLPTGFVYQYEVAQGQPRFRYVSASVEQMLGLTPEQLTLDAGLIFDLIPSAERAGYALAEARSAETLSDFSASLPFDLPDGRRRWLLVRSRPRKTSEGAVVWDGVALDVTDRQDAETRLQESEERFRRLFEETHQPTLLLEDGRYIMANRAALGLLGMDDPSQLVGRSPAELSPTLQPDGRSSADRAVELIAQAFDQGSIAFEWDHIRADGTPISLEVLVTVIRFGDKDLLHSVWNDVTEKKRAQAELDRYRQALEALVAQRTAALQQSKDELAHTLFAMDRAGIGIAWNTAETGRFLYANDEICRQLGYAREELLTLGVSDIDPEFPPDGLRQLAANMRAARGVVQMETLHRRKDQST